MYRLLKKEERINNSMEELCKCFLGLNSLEITLFKIIFEKPGLTCEELSSLVDRTRTPVQRAVKKLFDMSLIEREQESGADQPNFHFTYYPVNSIELKAHLLELVEKAKDEMVRIIKSSFPSQ